MLTFKSYITEAKGVSAKAQAAENKAFADLGNKLVGSKAIVSPAGFDAGFPDFAYRVKLKNGKTIDLHYEYKADYKAQMGSMRDWHFNGRKFSTPDLKSESKKELIDIMNNTPEAITNGKRLLKDLKTYFSKDVKKLYSGSMTIIKDKENRKTKAQEFANQTNNYQIAQITGDVLGQKIIDHYKTKFVKNLKAGSAASVLFMMLKDKIWLVDTNGILSKSDLSEIAAQHGLTKLDSLKNLSAKLEVRIQPRGLNSPKKHASIDAMASFRLAKAPAGGGKVI
jgi:hypothetical protein